MNKQVILMLAGERSGDQLGASLARTVKAQWPDALIAGMTGPEMCAAGVQTLVDNAHLDIIGLSGILSNSTRLWSAWQKLKKFTQKHRPIVICIDYPGFNLRFAHRAKKLGCKVMFIVSPQVWAWRGKRKKTIQRVVDHMAVLLPFEKKIYDDLGVSCTQIRHPLIDEISMNNNVMPNQEKPLVAICPGSRESEKENLLQIFIESAKAVKQTLPECNFIIVRAKTLAKSHWPALPEYIHYVDESDKDILNKCHAALVCSGTMTLKLALYEIPMVIAYKLPKFSYWIAKKLVKTEHIGLCNIVAQRRVAPELIQENVTVTSLQNALIYAIQSPHTQIDHWQQLRSSMDCPPITSLVDQLKTWIT